MNQQIDVPGVGIVEFPAGMSDADITKAITTQIIPNYSKSDSFLKGFGRATASLADTALDSVTGALDAAAYPLARAFGRTPDQATAETTSPKNVIGRAFGVQNTPEYKQEASRQVMEYIAQHFSEGADAISAKTGLPKADVENMMNTLTVAVGPTAAKVAGKTVDAGVAGAKAAAKVPGQVVQGALNVAKSDTPVASRVVPEPVIQQATSPVVPAPGSGTTPRPADIGPLGELIIRSGRGDVPVKGRGVEAATETALRGWKDALGGNLLGKGGLQTAADLAGLMGVGIPFQGSLMRGALPIAKSMSPIKAVDVPLGEGRTVPGYQRPSGGTYVSAEDMRGVGPRPVTPDTPAAPVVPSQPAEPMKQLGYTPAPLYASESGTVGKSAQAVSDAEFQAKYAPQRTEGAEPFAPAFKPAVEETKPARQRSGTDYKSEIETELANRIKANPSLERYNKDYVIPEHNQYSLEQFINGRSKSTLVYGGPGTGKTAIAGQWMAKNGGEMEYINVKDFGAKQAESLKDRLDVSHKPVLLLVDEADQLTTAQVNLVNGLVQHPNAQVLYTTNNLAKVKDSLKNQSNKIQMDVNLTPDQKAVFGLGRAVRGEMYGKPASDVIAAAQQGKSFRDIKRGVPELTGQQDMSAIKREPMFGSEHEPIDSTPRVQQILDDLENNRSPKNVVIIDKSVYQVDPEFSTKLNVYGEPRDSNIASMLANPTTASPLVRIVVSDSESAGKVSALKGLIERNNETQNPTNIIIEDRHGALDPAIRSRATVITAADVKKPAGPAPVAPTTPKKGGNPNVLSMMTEADLPGGPKLVEDSSMTKAGSIEQPLTPEQYDQFGIIQSLNPTDEYHYVRQNGDNIEELVKTTRRDKQLGHSENRKKIIHTPDGSEITFSITEQIGKPSVAGYNPPESILTITGLKLDGATIKIKQDIKQTYFSDKGMVPVTSTKVEGTTPTGETFAKEWKSGGWDTAPSISYSGRLTGRLSKAEKEADMKWIDDLDDPSNGGNSLWKPDF
jgi:hypothetical protein